MSALSPGVDRTDALQAENVALYRLLADIRAAAGDRDGRLMQPELVARIGAMSTALPPPDAEASGFAKRIHDDLINLGGRLQLSEKDQDLIVMAAFFITESSRQLRARGAAPAQIELGELPIGDDRICIKCHHCVRGIDRIACGLTDEVACADERHNVDGCGPSGMHFLPKVGK